MNLGKLRAQLVAHEGIRLRPYRCPAGHLTIGVGHNLDAAPLSVNAAMAQLDDDIAKTIGEIRKRLPWFDGLDDARQRVIADMAFNLGAGGLMKFSRMLGAVERGDYAAAADEMIASKWAEQTGARARRLAAMMVHGQDAPPEQTT